MRTILEVLRVRFEAGLSERSTAGSLGVPRSTVHDYVGRLRPTPATGAAHWRYFL